MFYLDVADQLSLLMTLCFSFFLFVASLWFGKSDSYSRLLGVSFASPLVFSVASLLVCNQAQSELYSFLPEAAILLSIPALALLNPRQTAFLPISTLLVAFPFAVWLADSSLGLYRVLLEPLVWISAYIVLAVVDMFVMKRESGIKGILFWPAIPLAVIPAVRHLVSGDLAGYLVLAFKLAAYLILLKYFYQAYYGALSSTVAEARNKIKMVDRSLDLEVKKRLFEIEQVNRSLVNKSRTDSLTRAYNKAAILEELENLAGAKGGGMFSVIMFDVDNFKLINDKFGHMEGDKCLKKLSIIARSNIREVDLLGRYGGDEFIILLPGVGMNQALQVAERFRKRVDSTESPHFTISAGVASYPEDGETAKELLKAADDGLYHSKSKGRNSVSYKKKV